MLSLLFAICMIWVFGKILFFGIKAAWGISKFLVTVVLLPMVLIGMVVGGLIYIAFPILIVAIYSTRYHKLGGLLHTGFEVTGGRTSYRKVCTA